MKTETNSSFKPAIIVIIATVLVLLTQYIPEGTKIFIYETKAVDFLSDVRIEEESSFFLKESKVEYTAASFNILPVVNDNILSFFNYYPEYTPLPAENIKGNSDMLKGFAQALANSKTSKVRIAHFGDSVIEGDLISADFRKNLQHQFGGNGVGFVPVNSHDIAFRTTTRISYSDNWKYGSIFSQNPDKLPVGINGAVAYTEGGSWVMWEATTLYGVKFFTSAKLYYQSDAGGKIVCSANNGSEKSFTLKSSKKVEEIDLGLSGKIKSIKVTVPPGTKGNFYGVSLEDGNGVYVDNLPLRGNSGIALRDIPESTLKDFAKYFDYDLIILNFGLNMLDQNTKDLSWYESAMNKNIASMKLAFPKAGILVIGVQDKAIKKGSKFVTDPAVLKVLEAQKKIAQESNVAFWNLYEAMGGEGAMSKWVSEGKASKDYTHVNTEGAKKMADLLTEALVDFYKSK